MYGSDAEFDKCLRGLQPRPPDLTAESAIPKKTDFSRYDPKTKPEPPRRTSKPTEAVDIGPYFKMPYRLFSSGLGAKLGQSAGWLYTALCSYANDNSSLTFSVSNRTLQTDTGMSPRTIGTAKKVLREQGLIEYSPKAGSKDQYTLKKLELERVKREERPTKKRKRQRKLQQEGDPWDELPQILRGTVVNYAQPYRKICAPV
jgi:hypothetical protein